MCPLNKRRCAAALLIAGLALPGQPAGVRAAAPPVVSFCGRPVAVIGADVTPANVPALRHALGMSPGTTELRESLADERAQAQGLLPPALLGLVAVSSVLFTPRPRGSGLDVTITNDVTLDPATAYANALLTAGVTDASVRVSAPPSQKALGTTALLGLLRAATTSCVPIVPAHRTLAIREIALNDNLAQYIGPRGAAARLLFALKGAAVAAGPLAPAATAALIAREAGAANASIPQAVQATLVAYLHDLTSSGAYGPIASAKPSITGTPPLQAIVRLAKPLTSTSPSTGSGATVRGVAAVGASAVGIAVRQANGQLRTYRPPSSVPVYRNGVRSSLGAIRRADTVVVTTNADGAVTRIDATASKIGTAGSGTPAGAVVRGTALVSGAGAAGLAVKRTDGTTRVYQPASNVPVYRDGVRSNLGAIRRADTVVVTINANGAVTRIDATVPKKGTAGSGAPVGGAAGATIRGVAAVGASAVGIAVRQADGQLRTYQPPSNVPVYRNGVRSSLGAIRRADTVVVTTNAAGAVTRIDATAPKTGTASGGARAGAIVRGVATAAVLGAGLAVRRADGTTHVYPLVAGLPIYRNGASSRRGAIQPTDKVTVTTNAAGQATRIDATSVFTRPAHGAVVVGAAAAAVTAGSLIVRGATGNRRYHPASNVPVYRNGAGSSLGAIKSSDAVTVTTNAAGGVTRIDASGPVAAVPAVAPPVAAPPRTGQNNFNPAWLWLLPLALLLGGLFLLGLLRRRGPLVVVAPAAVPLASPVVPAPAPVAPSSDIRVPVYQEELVVGKRQAKLGDVRLHKEVVVEQQDVPITLQHESVTVERIPFTAETDPNVVTHAFEGRDIEMPLMGEAAVVDKQTRVVEEVQLHKDVVQTQEQVTDTVRKEQVTVDAMHQQKGPNRPQAGSPKRKSR